MWTLAFKITQGIVSWEDFYPIGYYLKVEFSLASQNMEAFQSHSASVHIGFFPSYEVAVNMTRSDTETQFVSMVMLNVVCQVCH